jgi:hypothetical protein
MVIFWSFKKWVFFSMIFIIMKILPGHIFPKSMILSKIWWFYENVQNVKKSAIFCHF